MKSCERDVRSRDLELELMEGSEQMMPLVKRKNAEPHLLAVDARISVYLACGGR